jgi:hypothetical protein
VCNGHKATIDHGLDGTSKPGVAAKIILDGVAQGHELTPLRILELWYRAFLERQSNLHYVFTEKELEPAWQAVFGPLSTPDESRLGHPQERGIW